MIIVVLLIVPIYPLQIPQVYAANWLSGWAKRVKLTIDHTDITSALTDFPVLIYLSTASGRGTPQDDLSCVFNEIQSDANRKKIAVTTSDGVTQCYVEVEKWDTANSKAWLWTKAPSVSSTADTDLYLYYDKNHADNTAYVGDPTSTPAQSVWDGNHVAVWHLDEAVSDGTSGGQKDSTTNNNHGTPWNFQDGGGGATGTTGKIDGADYFAGDDDYVTVNNPVNMDPTSQLTVSAWIKLADGKYGEIVSRGDSYVLRVWDTGQILFSKYVGSNQWFNMAPGGVDVTDGTFHHVVGVQSATGMVLYVDGVQKDSNTNTTSIVYGLGSTLKIGMHGNGNPGYNFTGTIDEVRVSNTGRNAAWVKASYEGERDHFVDYGSEESLTTSWLSGWGKRVKLTIDHTDITSDLINFPVLVYLSTASGHGTPQDDLSCVFNEIQSDANRKKIAVTTSDGVAQCYVEVEKWDTASTKAWLWVNVPSVSSTVDTILYLYYDHGHADNTAYVGDIGSTPAKSVWDTNYKGVWHLNESSGTAKDSTSYATSGTYSGSPYTQGVSGKVDGASDFGPSSSGLINCGDPGDGHLDFGSGSFTVEFWINYDGPVSGYFEIPIYKGGSFSGDPGYDVEISQYSPYNIYFQAADGTNQAGSPQTVTPQDTWTYFVGVCDRSAAKIRLFKDGTEVGTGNSLGSLGSISTSTSLSFPKGTSGYLEDLALDEVRISNTRRPDAWIKASYEGERDHLIDYGSEESQPKTLLTYNSKYVVTSTTAVQTSSTSLQNDTQATQAFSLTASQTVLVIYQANSVNGALMSAYGMQNAINVDGTDYANSWDSSYDNNYCTRNTIFWIGTLSSGSHTIKGRFANMYSGDTATVSNRVLLIYILNGDAFLYLDSPTLSTTTSTSLVNDTQAKFTFTPSGSCKALFLYNIANSGATEDINGKKAAIRVDTTDYAQAEKSANQVDMPDSVFTVWAMGLSATSTTVQGRFARCSSGTVSIHRRQLGVLMFADDTLLDTVSSDTLVQTSLIALQNDSQAIISRTTSETRELLVVAMGTKRYGTSSSEYGECYGIRIDTNDRAISRGSAANGPDSADSAATAYAENLAAGSHTIRGRFAINYQPGSSAGVIDSRRIVALWLSTGGGGGPTTLLTFNSKYVVTSTCNVQTTSTSLQDDVQAYQTFSLSASQTVLVIYQANSVSGATMPAEGMQNAISVDDTDYAISWDSPFEADLYTARNTVFWIGTLGSGSHTIKGRFAVNTAGTATISNRILLIYILNGDAFLYLDNPTASTTSSSSLVDDPQAQFTFTPSGTCKALILYNVANIGATEDAWGKKAAINIGGTDYGQAEKAAAADDYPDSIFTMWALSLSASSTTVNGRFASNYAATVTIDRRQLGVLMFADSTLLDTVSSDTLVSTTSNSLVDDSQATISHTTTDARELLVVAMGTKRYNTQDSKWGECYGIKIDTIDKANSRGSCSYTSVTDGLSPSSAATAFAIYTTAGSHSIKGRFSNNYPGETAKIDSRRIVALWLSTTPGSQPANNFALTDGGSVAIGTVLTNIATLATSSFDPGNNFVIAVVQFSSTAATSIAAGNLRLSRGGTTITSNAYAIGIAASTNVNSQKWYALMAFDTAAPANPTYFVNATAAATGINGEAKILAISGLEGAMDQGGSTVIGASETTLATLSTSLPSGDNVALAILESENSAASIRYLTALNLKRDSTLAYAEFRVNYTITGTAAGKWQVQLIPYLDGGAPASAQYTVTATASSASSIYGRATIVAFSKGTLTALYSDGGSVPIAATETEINYLATSFTAGADVAVIASEQFDSTSSSVRTIAAAANKLQQNDQATGQTTNQYILRIPIRNANDDGKGFGLLNLFANIASSSPEYEVKATGSGTGVNGESKILALCKPPKVPEFPLGPMLLLAICSPIIFAVRRWKRTG